MRASIASGLCLLSAIADAALIIPQNVTIPNLTSNWTYSGCYTDLANGQRSLNAAAYANTTSMTVESCIAFCYGKNYNFAGSEWSQECYCDNILANASTIANDTDCNSACKGNSSEACGGASRLSVYWSGKPSPAGPFINPGPGNWSSLGCYNDSNARTLRYAMLVPGGTSNTTVSSCTTTCGSAGYTYAGIEYAGECWCDTQIQSPGGPATDGCTFLCNGNSSELCGGSFRMNMYMFNTTKAALAIAATSSTSSVAHTTSSNAVKIAGSTSTPIDAPTATTTTAAPTTTATTTSVAPTTTTTTSAAAQTTTTSASSASATVVSSSVAQTTPSCPAATGAIMIDQNFANYSIYCASDTSIGSYGNGYASNNWTQCAALCDASATCVAFVYLGGANGIGGGNCYYKSTVGKLVPSTNTGLVAGILNSPGQKASLISTTAGVVQTSTTAQSTTSSAPVVTSLPSGWKYGGCYIDNVNGRIMGHQQAGGSTNTVESCVATCAAANYTVAGMEYGQQCFCDNAIVQGGALTGDKDCSMACAGNSAEFCGAGNRMSVYYTGSNLTVYQVPSAQQTAGNGNWKYMGCLTDTGNPRTLPWQLILTNNNTAENCLGQCAKFGYMAAGMEYGIECYCGDLPDVAAAGATIMPDSQCSTTCSGDPTHVCGGGSRLSYYNWIGPPLYTFNYPSGNAAGSYSLLIGGVTIPLVTQQTVTGKVTFLEKVGTGPGNDTGAYELDLSQINNFTAAWRPMHTKTDVFCSASITLPDKAGRQLNIGGWSLSSTFGVRIYWPDGSAGVWGHNDWQENVNELSLQSGRWYPSAMIMSNGSVLVVGGETGSNSGPVPSLELLPRAGAPVYLDFLNRTDPNNLYPFLVVLPSGGIFVAYYNEARILDENTFATIKTLPNCPTAVNNFLGGRTYPLEGTAVLMPQYAPYSDNLAVMICGGSTNGGGEALDNCVTTRPEDSSPTWVLERMPSRRVMSCIAALPDGTYLILNGAKQGVAGFGLAKNPNLNAILYDPSKPVGSRMSIMANTTVARMYHSEAILLQDGRVMVSGSDPQDGVNPEEYRVEVFTPPYLMGNPARPTFSLGGATDWAYGASIAFTTTATNVRVSLMGGEASTHGNSMGQRTLFPAVSCSGGQCTVTAPPNAHVCPPGWYQMFVLDGPTPSVSIFVRIGGDPGSVGNWPNYPDFKTPGVGPVGS